MKLTHGLTKEKLSRITIAGKGKMRCGEKVTEAHFGKKKAVEDIELF